MTLSFDRVLHRFLDGKQTHDNEVLTAITVGLLLLIGDFFFVDVSVSNDVVLLFRL